MVARTGRGLWSRLVNPVRFVGISNPTLRPARMGILVTTQPTRRLIRAGFSLRNAKRTAREQAATILLPNCLTREGTGRAYAVPIGEKDPINRDFLVRSKQERTR